MFFENIRKEYKIGWTIFNSLALLIALTTFNASWYHFCTIILAPLELYKTWEIK